MTTSIQIAAEIDERVYTDVLILTENEFGQTGFIRYGDKTYREIADYCEVLSSKGFEPIEVQVGESQETLFVKWWK